MYIYNVWAWHGPSINFGSASQVIQGRLESRLLSSQAFLHASEQISGKKQACHVAFDTGTGVIAGPKHIIDVLKQEGPTKEELQ